MDAFIWILLIILSGIVIVTLWHHSYKREQVKRQHEKQRREAVAKQLEHERLIRHATRRANAQQAKPTPQRVKPAPSPVSTTKSVVKRVQRTSYSYSSSPSPAPSYNTSTDDIGNDLLGGAIGSLRDDRPSPSFDSVEDGGIAGVEGKTE